MKFIRIKNLHFQKKPDERLKALGIEQDSAETIVGEVAYPFDLEMLSLETAFDKNEAPVKGACNLVYGDITAFVQMEIPEVISLLKAFVESDNQILELTNKQH